MEGRSPSVLPGFGDGHASGRQVWSRLPHDSGLLHLLVQEGGEFEVGGSLGPDRRGVALAIFGEHVDAVLVDEEADDFYPVLVCRHMERRHASLVLGVGIGTRLQKPSHDRHGFGGCGFVQCRLAGVGPLHNVGVVL